MDEKWKILPEILLIIAFFCCLSLQRKSATRYRGANFAFNIDINSIICKDNKEDQITKKC